MSQTNSHSNGAAWDDTSCRRIIRDLAGLEGPLLPVLHAVNGHFGYIGEDAVRLIAEELNLSRADVHGVVSFYHDFRREPAGRHVMKICRAEACQALGAQRMFDEIANACSRAGDVTVEAVYCLGNCALGPAGLIDGELCGRLDAQSALSRIGR